MNNFFKNKQLVVVGASGYIGSKLVLELSKINCTIIRITRDKDKLISFSNTLANIIDYEVNYDNINWNDILQDSDIVYYLSSQTSIYIAEKDILEDYNSSVKPLVGLLKYCEEYKNKLQIIFASAVTISGLTNVLPVNENTRDNPITIYDAHKLLIENYIKFYSSKNIIQGTSLRLANVYGPGVQSSSNDRGILNKMIYMSINGNNLSVYGSGEYVRDYVHIDDVVNAFLKASKHINKTTGNHYIISSGEGNTIKEAFKLITKKVSQILQVDTKIHNVDAPDTLALIEHRNFIGNSDNFFKATGWKHSIKFDDGIENTIKYFTGNKNG